MALLQLLAVLLDDVPAAREGASLLGGEIGVASRAVPVTGDGLGVKGDLDVVKLTNAEHDVPGNPQVVTHLNASARANLVLPLRGKDLAINTGDVDSSCQAHPGNIQCMHQSKLIVSSNQLLMSPVMDLADVTSNGDPGSSSTVVGALRCREASLGPAQGPLGNGVEQSILLSIMGLGIEESYVRMISVK